MTVEVAPTGNLLAPSGDSNFPSTGGEATLVGGEGTPTTDKYTSKDISERPQVCILLCVKSEWPPFVIVNGKVSDEDLAKVKSYLDFLDVEVDNLEEIVKTCHDPKKAICMEGL
ncbi:hypothetical protein RF11_09702 [Thelohanellus kitauei]|uniref:Uncharacterized protein n=1 Tax=Thelohanellus kitauei TaxID=669202 RepID=A0A0C2IY91_THEKT|nr:hypothetical protein RF11_09702 [Thelohanellus kitauei]